MQCKHFDDMSAAVKPTTKHLTLFYIVHDFRAQHQEIVRFEFF